MRDIATLESVSNAFFVRTKEHLLKLDESGEILASLDFSNSSYNTLKAWPEQHCLLLQSKSGFYKIDSSLNILETNLSATTDEFNSFATRQNEIYLLSKTTSNGVNIIVMDTFLQAIGEMPLGANNLVARELAIREQTLAVTGNETPDQFNQIYPPDSWSVAYQHKGSNLFFRTLNLSGNNEAEISDIGVIDIQVNGEPSAGPALDYCYVDNYPGHNVSIPDIKVRVKNYGLQSVEHLKLNASFSLCSFICGTRSTHLRTFNTDLQPGEYKGLNFGNINVWGTAIEPTLELCIWTSIPDQQMDANYENNRHCISLVITDTDSPSLSSGIRLFPSPANETLEIHLENPPLQEGILRVYDRWGRLLSQDIWKESATQMSLPVIDFPNGVYMVDISFTGQHISRKFVKN